MIRYALLALGPLVLACTPPAGDGSTVVFENVTVVPMDRDQVLPGQTVVVEGATITAVGPAAEVRVPAGATRVDGNGKFLMPGLAEMHAHIPPGTQVTDAEIERVLGLFALNGVTTVRGMLGHPRHLPLRDRAARGELLSPRIYTSSPSLNGNSMATVAMAIDSVTKYQAAGYDFLKVHPGISREVFDTIAATARRLGIPYAGHVPLDVGIEHAIELGFQTVDHIDGFVEGLVPHTGAFTPQQSGFFGIGVVMRADESRLAGLAERARAAGVWIVPTETLMRHVFGNYTTDELRSWPEMKYWAQGLDGWVTQTAAFQSNASVTPEMKARYLALRKTLISELHRAGVGFLLGSDAPQIWNVPGFSVRRELEYLVDAGLTPFQALETGTANVAKFYGTEAETGTVAVGKRADLILLDGNPLTDIRNVGNQAGVMVGGRWIARAEVDSLLTTMLPR